MLFKCVRRPKGKYRGSLAGFYIYIDAETAAKAKTLAEKHESMKVNSSDEYSAIVAYKYVTPVNGEFGYL